jgi:glutathione peroxidase
MNEASPRESPRTRLESKPGSALGGSAFYRFTATSLDGRAVSMDDFRGKVVVVVNTASRCGFTPQYAGLEELYQRYKDRGFVVLGFPCNQFGAQEPGSESQIASFCETNYGVTFPLFARVDVNGANAHPIFKFLKAERPGLLGIFGMGAIRWNFTKFLLDREGRVVARFAPATAPANLGPAIEQRL